MTKAEDIVRHALAQKGDRYVFGAEVSPLDPDPERFDCSELVEWACARAGLSPRMPDGAFNQWKHCRDHKLNVGVGRALATRGALLFVGDGTGVGREAITHVAFSLGNGTTIEARGSKWGVGTWAGQGRFQWGCLIPGVSYGHGSPHAVVDAPSGSPPLQVGSTGDRVTALQRALNRAFAAGLVVDGDFGPRTKAAVVAMQRATRIEVDGIYGPQSAAALAKRLE